MLIIRIVISCPGQDADQLWFAISSLDLLVCVLPPGSCTQEAGLTRVQSACVLGSALAHMQATQHAMSASRLVLCRSLTSDELTIFKAALAQTLQSYGVVSSYITIGTPTPVAGRRLLQASLGAQGLGAGV